jgi:LacI family transcriptional regulator
MPKNSSRPVTTLRVTTIEPPIQSRVKTFYRSTSTSRLAIMTPPQEAHTAPAASTIYDVAAKAAVSISTVSLALNNPTRVSHATRTKVLEAADELGYVPRSEAVSRARRSVGRMGVIAPFTSYGSFARRLNGILISVRDEALDVVVFDEPSAATSPNPLLAAVPLTHRLDGLIVMALPLEPSTVARLHQSGLPTVLIDIPSASFDSVNCGDEMGGRLAAQHLSSLGYPNYAFFGEAQRSHAYTSPAELRLRGFREEIAKVGITEAAVASHLTDHRGEGAYADARRMLEASALPLAVFAHDDMLASSVLRAAHDLGLRVPADVAVVGYDDGELAEGLQLTTIRQAIEESGRTAVGLLRDRIGQDHKAPSRPVQNVTLAPELARRRTA